MAATPARARAALRNPAGDIATHYLPPDFPGFDAAGGTKGTGADFLANPRGDMAVAKKYMLAAKKEDPSLPIDANGMWTDSTKLLMVASNADPGKKTGEVAQAQFGKLGIKVNFRTAPQDTLYLWDKIPTVESADVRGVVNQYSTSWDMNFTSLK